MRVQVQERLHTETALRYAASRDELWLAYQPVVDLATGECHGAEALLRWSRTGRGPQAAMEFIRIAEESGLIVPIGRWVAWEACWFLVRWRQTNPDVPMKVGVNLSAEQLRDPSLVGDFSDIIHNTGVDPTDLWIEVTETVLVHDVELTLERLRGLKKLGLRIAVDDFGTGYSSLAYLKRFPVDVLKIDKSFVDNVQSDPEDAAIVRATVQLAAALGLSVVAEGVETEEQRHALVMLGCTRGQGYHFARPMPATELEAYILGAGTPGW